MRRPIIAAVILVVLLGCVGYKYSFVVLRILFAGEKNIKRCEAKVEILREEIAALKQKLATCNSRDPAPCIIPPTTPCASPVAVVSAIVIQPDAPTAVSTLPPAASAVTAQVSLPATTAQSPEGATTEMRQYLAKKVEQLKLTLTEEQQVIIKSDFYNFDLNRDGVIVKKEINTLLSSVSIKLTDDEIAHFIKRLDADGNGNIEYDEFFIVKSKVVLGGDERIRQKFQIYDKNKNDYIDKEELKDLLEGNVGIPVRSNTLVSLVMELVDIDGDDKLDSTEAKEIFNMTDYAPD